MPFMLTLLPSVCYYRLVLFTIDLQRFAHKKGLGSSRNGRDSAGRRLGIKIFGGEEVTAGNIILRQRGTKWHAGRNVGVGRDHTLFALIDGKLEFRSKTKGRVFVSVLPMTEAAAQ